MANAFSSLVVRLGLDAAEFITGLEKTDREAKKIAANMERDAKKIGAAIGLYASSAATALFLMTKASIDAADKLNDLSKSTGISAEKLGGLGFAAKQSGTDLEGVVASVGKLNQKIAQAVAGNEDAALAFKKVDISLKQLRESSPDQILQKLADRFATYDDHANTAALANFFFSKSYASILPLLRDGGDSLAKNIAYFEKYGGVNDDVVRRADQFNDTLTKLGLLSGALGRNLAAELLPSLQDIADEFVSMKEKGDGFKGTASDIATVLKGVASFAAITATKIADIGDTLGALGAQASAIASLEFSRAVEIGREADRAVDERYARLDRMLAAIRGERAATMGWVSGSDLPSGLGGRLRRAPSLPDAGAAGAANAAAKALLDARLRDVDNYIKEERDLYKDRQHFLREYYADDLISIAKYFSTRQQFLDDSVRKEVAANDEKIALLRAFRPKDEADRIKTEREIADLIANTRKVQREYFNESIQGRIEEARAVKQFNESLQQVQITLAAMRGDTVGAATMGVTEQYRKLRTELLREGRSTADVDEIIKRTTQQAQLTKATQEYQLTLSELGIEQERINIAASSGRITELEALRQRSDLQTSYIPKLQQELEIAREIAAATGKREDIVRVKELTVALEGLAAQGDLVAKKFREIFETGFADAFASFIDGSKSAKEAFKDFANSVIRDVNRIIAKELANKLASSLFGTTGTSGTAGGGNDWMSMLVKLGMSYATGGTGIGYGTAGSAIPAGPYPYAKGTNFHPGGWAIVGEQGRELINLPRGSQVIPNHEVRRMESGRVVNQYIMNMPGVTKQSSSQSAGQLRRGMMQAARDW